MSVAPMPAETQAPFNRRTVFWVIAASLLAAAGFVLLSTYAPDFRLGRDGGASPLSKSGTGFAGLVELMTLLDDAPQTARSLDELDTDALVVVTIAPDSNADALKDIIEARQGRQTLFVLPKWSTMADPAHAGWELHFGRLSAAAVDQWLGYFVEAKIGREPFAAERLYVRGDAFAPPAPRDLQWVTAEGAEITAGSNHAVLLAAKDQPFFVLTDPDLLNNTALKDQARANAAIRIVNMLRSSGAPVLFDLTLHGANRKHDLMKLLLEPPFLALTLSVLAAAALALLHGLGRFGPTQAEVRAIPFGKRALADTTARLMRRAGRLDHLGGRYAAQMRRRAAALLGAPQGLRDDALDQWLDARDKNDGQGYAALSDAARRAGNEAELTVAARRLHQWIARRLRERR